MKIAFIESKETKEIIEYLIEKYNFEKLSIKTAPKFINLRAFGNKSIVNSLRLKEAIEYLRKDFWLSLISARVEPEKDAKNFLVDDVSLPFEISYLQAIDFVVFKIVKPEIEYESTLDSVKLIKIDYEEDKEKMFEVITSIIEDYAKLYENRYDNLTIKYTDGD